MKKRRGEAASEFYTFLHLTWPLIHKWEALAAVK